MEDKSTEGRTKIVEVLLMVALISVAVLFVNLGIGLSSQGEWGLVNNILPYINYISVGLFLAAIIGIFIIAIIGRLKKDKRIPK